MHISGAKLIRFVVFTTALTATSCTTVDPAFSNFVVRSSVVLDNQLLETSGLYCDGEDFLTINDSGNPATLHRLNKTGAMTNTALTIDNKDWEAITASPTHIYIADMGNNFGQRSDLVVYKLPRDNLSDATELVFQYFENTPTRNLPMSHDFDAEAIVHKDDELLIFSKSWKSQNSKVYRLDTQKSAQLLKPEAVVEGLPGLITGADYDESRQAFVVVGYQTRLFGKPSPFLALLNNDFAVIDVYSLQGFGQVEGVCASNGDIWFTQEAVGFSRPKLVNVQITQQGV